MRWAAEYAVNRFDVTLLGLRADNQDAERSTEEVDGYRIVRLPRKLPCALSYVFRFLQACPLRTRLTFVLVMALLVPLLAMVELGRRVIECIAQPSRDPSWIVAGVLWAMRGPALKKWIFLIPASLVFAPLVIALEIYVRVADLAFQLTRRIALSRIGSPELRAWLDELRGVRGKLLSHVREVTASLRDQLAPAMRMLDEIEAMPRKPGTIHCRGLATLLVGVLAKKRYGCRVVYDIDEFCKVGGDECTCIEATIRNFVEGALIRQVDAAVTEHPMLSTLIAQRYGLPSVHTIPNAAPWVPPARSASRISDMAQLSAGRVAFLFQGDFTSDPGVTDLIGGWAHTNPETCVLFLRGPDNIWRQRALEQAAALGMLGRNIYFLPPGADGELAQMGTEAAVGLLPYYRKNVRNKFAYPDEISQYLHAGLAILANDQPNVRPVIEASQAGVFYSSLDPLALARSVDELLAEPDHIPRLRRNAHAYAETVFNWQKICGVLYDQYVPTGS